MELITKLENLVAGWTKNVPHLPAAGQRWLGQNVWWIVLIGTILTGIGVLFSINGIFQTINLLNTFNSTIYGYYAVANISAMTVVAAVVALAFSIAMGLVMALSIKPLQLMQKKGWTLLFVSWLIEAIAVVVNAILGLSVFGFIFAVIFGAIFLAISGYFIFEIRGQFAHVTKTAKTTKTKAA